MSMVSYVLSVAPARRKDVLRSALEGSGEPFATTSTTDQMQGSSVGSSDTMTLVIN